MKLTVFNGSPRFKQSSTKIIIDEFAAGFLETDGNTVETEYLVRTKDADRFVQAFQETDQALLAFPLYHDSMPSIVKTFVESLEPLKGRAGNPRMLFSIHSGFAESIQCRYVERYMRKLADRLGSECAGAILPGSVHRLEQMPAMAAKPKLKAYRELGRVFGETGELDEALVVKLAKPERFTGVTLQLVRFMYWSGLGNSGWNKLAKKQGGYEDRLARPYVD